MIDSKKLVLAFATAYFTVIGFAFAADENTSALYVIFDGSNSMWGELPDKTRKITAARDAFSELDTALFDNRQVALRLYGHRMEGDCADTELSVPFTAAETGVLLMNERIRAVTPRGKTPITRSLQAALEDFGDRRGDILLISDGIETCDADPCELVRSWRENDIDIRVHVVGLGLNDLARGAMQCIADAAGTTYLDASNASELAAAITTASSGVAIVPGVADPAPQFSGSEFYLSAVDENGYFVPVQGTISVLDNSADENQRVASNGRYVIAGGRYILTAGVPTVNGELYRPVTQEIEVSATGTTRIQLELRRPPMVRTRFLQGGELLRGANASAQKDGIALFNLRPGEDYYIMPGRYEFLANLNQDNAAMSAAVTIVEGDDRFIDFDVVQTVRALFVVTPEGSDQRLRQNQQLYQDGELKYELNFNNGGDIKPGVYTLRSADRLSPYEIDGVEVLTDPRQTMELTVPMAFVSLQYEFLESPATSDRRCWLRRLDSDGNLIARSAGLRCEGTEYALTDGRYEVMVFNRLGEFAPTVFNIEIGQRLEVSVVQTAVPE